MHPVHRAARSTTRVVVDLAVVLVLLGGLGLLVPGLLGLERYVITGASMTGSYDKGSLVFERAVPTDRLAVGDVVTYLPPRSSGVTNLVTHRIVTITRDPHTGQRVFRTRGDHNPKADPWTFRTRHTLQPRVVFSVPYVGFLLVALADRSTRMLVVGVPALLIALLAVVELGRVLRPTGARHAVEG